MTDAAGGRIAVRLNVAGQVQGVGFRPFVHRLAVQCQLGGRVANTTDGVVIELEGREEDVEQFRRRLATDSPTPADVAAVDASAAPMVGRTTFTIDASHPDGSVGTRVPPDLALCAECRRELFDPADRRYCYPFTNCTACGPRYSIIERIPYDRARTTMSRFAQCHACESEYSSPADRRFHAEPNACPTCGPAVALWDETGRCVSDATGAIPMAADLLRRGGIVAVKGLGGFQLIVRADDVAAIQRLRRCKHRPAKPLAVMTPDLATAERLVVLGSMERRVLMSPQNPIVLARRRAGRVPDAIAPSLNDVGVFLPTTPLHALLLAELGAPVVATSGNRGDEPIVIDECEAVEQLQGIADAFLVHDRPIRRRIDDSVVAVIDGRATALRLARGYSPLPLPALEQFDGPPILALGGHQKSALALWNGRQALLGPHIGDLDAQPTRSAMGRTASDLGALYKCAPDIVVCDLHPDYFTTRWAEQSGRQVFQVQHHHAHIAAAQVEHGLLDREVLGIAWDGTGFGTDGTLWGGEFLRVEGVRFLRTASLLPLPLPGGEAAIRHPGRIAFSLLHSIGQTKRMTPHGLERMGVTSQEAVVFSAMLDRNINVVWSSGVGRLFDAVAALIIPMAEITFEGEAAMRLEAVADPSIEESYTIPPRVFDSLPVGDAAIPRGDWRPMIAAIVEDLKRDVPPSLIAARFHNALAGWAVQCVENHPDRPIVLAGGCFQNRLLTERVADKLRSLGRECLTPGLIPAGDGGLAAGQLAVAMAQINGTRPRKGAA